MFQDRLDQLDVVLCTLTVPYDSALRTDEIAQGVADDHTRHYFFNNYRNVIRTAQDQAILEATALRLSYVEVNETFFIRSGGRFDLSGQYLGLGWFLQFYTSAQDQPCYRLSLIKQEERGNEILLDTWDIPPPAGSDTFSSPVPDRYLGFLKDPGHLFIMNSVQDLPERMETAGSLNTRQSGQAHRTLRLYKDGRIEIWDKDTRLAATKPDYYASVAILI